MPVTPSQPDLPPDARLQRLLDIMARLRSADGCPWDAEQTPETLKPYLVEETYEVLDAIDDGVPEAVRDELGDLLLQVVFQSRIFEERGEFSMADVVDAISDKLIRRHPHVFGDIPFADLETLDAQWEAIKLEEQGRQKLSTPSLINLPRHLPALQSAQKIVKKIRKQTEATAYEQIPEQIIEHLEELFAGVRQEQTPTLAPRFGRILFTLVELGHNLGIDAEEALRQTNKRVVEHWSTKPNSGNR